MQFPGIAIPAGDVILQGHIDGLLDRASELLHHAPICDLLRECYAFQPANNSGPTFAASIARLMTRLFAEHGLIVMDAAGRVFHTLGASTLRFAIEHAEELEAALLARSAELEAAGYHAQVLVKPGASLLFLIERDRWLAEPPGTAPPCPTGVGRQEQATPRPPTPPPSCWRFSTPRPSGSAPMSLLRAVFQDTILPTAAYIGGPAEVAYFAQSAVIYQRILGRITPILPRLSATLIEPAIGAVMAQHEVSLTDAMRSTEDLAQRLAARALPIEAKRSLAAAGNALDEALAAAQDYLGGWMRVWAVSRGFRLEDALPDGPPAPPGCHHRDATRGQPAQTRRRHLAAPLPQGPVAGARAGRGLVPGRVGVHAGNAPDSALGLACSRAWWRKPPTNPRTTSSFGSRAFSECYRPILFVIPQRSGGICFRSLHDGLHHCRKRSSCSVLTTPTYNL